MALTTKKKLIGLFVVITGLLAPLLSPGIAGAFSGGGLGSNTYPYRISNCSQLQEINNDLNARYVLTGNIDCSGTSAWNSGAGFDPIGPSYGSQFTGSFDGRNYTISGLTINRPGQSDIGLFGFIHGTVKNVHLTNLSVQGNNYVGGLVGEVIDSTVSGVSVEGTVHGSVVVGGLVGVSANSTFSRTSFTGDVTDTSAWGGGLVAFLTDSNINNSFVDAEVTGANVSAGIAGYVSAGDGATSSITNSYFVGTEGDNNYFGGIAGIVTMTGSGTVNFSNLFMVANGLYGGSPATLQAVGRVDSGTPAVNALYVDQTVAGGANCGAVVGCTFVNTDGSDGDHFKNTHSIAPIGSWESDWNSPVYWQTNPSDFPTLKEPELDALTPLGTPSNPNIQNISGEGDHIDLNWVPPSDDYLGGSAIIEYRVEYSPAGQNDWTVIHTGNTDLSYTITGLTPGQSYDVQVAAVNSSGTGAYGIVFNIQVIKHAISTCQDLQNIEFAPDQDYTLEDDIDCSATSGWNDDGDGGFYGFIPIEEFTGSLDGQGHQIQHLTMTQHGGNGVALFYEIYGEASISDLSITDLNVTAWGGGAGLVGYAHGDYTISGVSVAGTINSSEEAGGLVAETDNYDGSSGFIENSQTNVQLLNSNNQLAYDWGGLIGYVYAGDGDLTITESFAQQNLGDYQVLGSYGGLVGSVELDPGANLDINGSHTSGSLAAFGPTGGLVGDYFGYWSDGQDRPRLTLNNSYSDADVMGGGLVGGLVGAQDNGQASELYISQSYYTGNVLAADGGGVGGLVGVAIPSTGNLNIDQSYATGTVTSECCGEAGGLVGSTFVNTTINDSYADTDITGTAEIGGLVGLMDHTQINRSYAAGEISASGVHVGGLAGLVYSGSISDSFAANAFDLPDGADDSNDLGAVGYFQDGHLDFHNAVYDRDLSGRSYCARNWSNNYITNEDCAQVNGEGSEPGHFKSNTISTPFKNADGEQVWDFGDIWGATQDDYPVLLANPERGTIHEVDHDIDDCDKLQDMKYDLDGDFQLTQDISCGSTWSWNEGQGFMPVGGPQDPFTGTLEGNGYTIYDLNIHRDETSFVGLFGNTQNASLSNFRIYGESTVEGDNYVGLIAGSMNGGSINNVRGYEQIIGNSRVAGLVGNAVCEEEGGYLSITSSSTNSWVFGKTDTIGGAIGYLNTGAPDCDVTINTVRSSGSVLSWGYPWPSLVGGFVGYIDSLGGSITISNSSSEGEVQGSGQYIGGFVGYQYTEDGGQLPSYTNLSADVDVQGSEDSYSVGGFAGEIDNGANIYRVKATGEIVGGGNLGGLIGYMSGDIFGTAKVQESYATGDVTLALDNSESFGGLIGAAQNITVQDSYATGDVNTSFGSVGVGGLIGYMSGDVVNSYATGSTQGGSFVGGLIGYYNGTNLTNAYGVKTSFATGFVSGADGDSTAGLIGFTEDSSALHYNYYDISSTDQVNCALSNLGPINNASCDFRNLEGEDNGYFINNSDTQPFRLEDTQVWDFDDVWVTQEDEYPKLRWDYTPWVNEITNCRQLQAMNQNLGEHYSLANDIDCSNTVNWNSGAGFNPIGDGGWSFAGSFNGRGHTITGLYINRPETNPVGLFGSTHNAFIWNVNLSAGETGVTNGQNETGGLIGLMYGGTVSNVATDSDVNSGNDYAVGGLIGHAYCNEDGGYITVSDSSSDSDVTYTDSPWAIGGLIGYIEIDADGCTTTIQNNTSSGAVTMPHATEDTFGGWDMGGLIGEIDSYTEGSTTTVLGNTSSTNVQHSEGSAGGLVGYVYNSYDSAEEDTMVLQDNHATGFIVTNPNDGGYAGGLVGYSQGAVYKDSTFDGLVSSPYDVGGLVGWLDGGYANKDYIVRSSARGSVINNSRENERFGGLVGGISDGNIRDSYARNVISAYGGSNVGGIAGFAYGDIVNSYSTSEIRATDGEGSGKGGLVGFYDGSGSDAQDGLLNNFSTSWFNFDHDGPAPVGIAGIIGLSSQENGANNLESNYFDEDLANTNACSFRTQDVTPLFCQTAAAGNYKENQSFGPLENWDFTDTWSEVSNDYPELRPYIPKKYNIESCEDLQNINNDLAGHYTLENNIDCADHEDFQPIGRGEGLAFTGSLDGQGYEISNLLIFQDEANNVGLFGQAAAPAYIHDFTLRGIVAGGGYVGGIVGRVYENDNTEDGVTIEKIGNYAGVYSSGDYTGGLVGYSDSYVIINNSYNQGPIEAQSHVGGLLGYTDQLAEIFRSYNSGNIDASAEVGGIASYIGYGIIDHTFSAGPIQAAEYMSGVMENGGEVWFLNNYLDEGRTGMNQCVERFGGEECNLVNTMESQDPEYFFNNSTNAPFTDDEGGWDFENVWHTNHSSFPTLGIRQSYLITNCEELQNMRDDRNGDYTLANDIDCSDTVNWNDGEGFEPVGSTLNQFRGVLNGNDHSIIGLYENVPAGPVGLFRYINGGEVTNLAISGRLTTSQASCAGGITGYANGIDIANVRSSVTIESGGEGGVAGGLIGCLESDSGATNTIHDSQVDANLTGFTNGGIIGSSNTSDGATLSLQNDFTSGQVLCAYGCGGIVGLLYHEWDGMHSRQGVNVDSVGSTMNISSFVDTGGLIGGLTANGVDMTLAHSFFTGSINAGSGDNVGGLIGSISSDGHFPYFDIEQNLVETNISNAGANVGGLIGSTSDNTYIWLANSYYNGDIEANGANVGGLIGLVSKIAYLYDVYASGSIVNIASGTPWTGGLIGYHQEGQVVNSFAAMDISTPNATPFASSGLIGDISVEDVYLNNNYYNSDVGEGYCADGDIDYVSTEGCIGFSLSEEANKFIANDQDEPINIWNFGNTWHIRENNYPTLTPAYYYILCEEPGATSTTVHVHCGLNMSAGGLGATTWEMQYRLLDGSDDWKDVDLADSEDAQATITGLSPNTWYNIRFRYTNDTGVSEWARVEALTSSNGQIDGGVTSSSSSSSSPSKKKVSGSSSSNDENESEATPVTDEDQKVTLNDFIEYINGSGKHLSLKVGQVIYFTAGGNEHSATVKEVGPDYVILTLASTPQDVRIELGQTGSYDVTEDGNNDIKIQLVSINNGVVSLVFTQVADTDTTALKASKDSSLSWLYILLAIVIAYAILRGLNKHQKSKTK